MNNNIDIYINELKQRTAKTEITDDNIFDLVRKAKKKDEDAYEKLVIALQPLIINIAKKYNNSSVDLMDLIQEWNIWLIKAIDKFNFDNSVKFTTYLVYWIRYYIQKWISDNVWNIHIPRYIIDRINLYNKVYQDLLQKRWEEPDEKEIANNMWISFKELKEIISIIKWIQSLDQKIDEDSNNNYWDYLISDNILTPDQLIEQKYLKQEIEVLLAKKLNKRELNLIKEYYGIWVDKKTLVELSKKYKISKERIKQIVSKLIKKLK